MTTPSLRFRLFAIILLPLLIVAGLIAIWRVGEARATAATLQDRTLMFTALAIARDVSLGAGDIITGQTEQLLSEASGGPLRYHVYAPDGVFVIGYAAPPVPLSRDFPQDSVFAYYDASSRGASVRVLRLRDESQFDGLSGTFTITVWQSEAVRAAFVQDLAIRALAIIAALVGAVALLLWFGVNLGLKPLLDLEDAISARSPEDLSPIRRPVPVEARGLVQRLNRLFGQVRTTMESQAAFISNAAHQLRNPIAGVRALGEAIQTAPSLEAAQARATDLVAAAEAASDLAQQLLTLERARARPAEATSVDIVAIAQAARDDIADRAHSIGVDLTIEGQEPVSVIGDLVMLREALLNLVRNALSHGGPGLSQILISVASSDDTAEIRVTDNGKGVDPKVLPSLTDRFAQGAPGPGSGLGLSIVDAVARQHGGTLRLETLAPGFSARLSLPFGT